MSASILRLVRAAVLLPAVSEYWRRRALVARASFGRYMVVVVPLLQALIHADNED